MPKWAAADEALGGDDDLCHGWTYENHQQQSGKGYSVKSVHDRLSPALHHDKKQSFKTLLRRLTILGSYFCCQENEDLLQTRHLSFNSYDYTAITHKSQDFFFKKFYITS